MTTPDSGVERLLHFVDRRLDQLGMSKEELARRGGPENSTLYKVRNRQDQNTPRVSTLLRLDKCLGWQPGSAAAILLGGKPLSVAATPDVRGLDAPAVIGVLLNRLGREITAAHASADDLQHRIRRLEEMHRRLVEEFGTPELLSEFRGDDAATGS